MPNEIPTKDTQLQRRQLEQIIDKVLDFQQRKTRNLTYTLIIILILLATQLRLSPNYIYIIDTSIIVSSIIFTSNIIKRLAYDKIVNYILNDNQPIPSLDGRQVTINDSIDEQRQFIINMYFTMQMNAIKKDQEKK